MMSNGSEIIRLVSGPPRPRTVPPQATGSERLTSTSTLCGTDPTRHTRSAYQRLYDMILSYGVETESRSAARSGHALSLLRRPRRREARTRSSASANTLHQLVNALKSAAQGYGIERRVLLLHGPVGSSKSTIARLLKKGLERYSATDEGALYTLGWVDEDEPEPDEDPVVPDERGAAAPDPARGSARMSSRQLNEGPRRGRLPRPDRRLSSTRSAASSTSNGSRSTTATGPALIAGCPRASA